LTGTGNRTPADLTAAGFPPVEVEQEFVIVDSNPALDPGSIADAGRPVEAGSIVGADRGG